MSSCCIYYRLIVLVLIVLCDALQFGASGSQLADPACVEYLERKGLDYLLCPVQAVPSVKISAAQAHIRVIARAYKLL